MRMAMEDEFRAGGPDAGAEGLVVGEFLAPVLRIAEWRMMQHDDAAEAALAELNQLRLERRKLLRANGAAGKTGRRRTGRGNADEGDIASQPDEGKTIRAL